MILTTTPQIEGHTIREYAIESAYAFFHQKQLIYQYSTLDWQKDDIEYAIEDYVSQQCTSSDSHFDVQCLSVNA